MPLKLFYVGMKCLSVTLRLYVKSWQQFTVRNMLQVGSAAQARIAVQGGSCFHSFVRTSSRGCIGAADVSVLHFECQAVCTPLKTVLQMM